MKSRIKKRKPCKGTAVNDRKTVYKYFPTDDTHSVAIKAGRCHKCGKITTDLCDSCVRFTYKNHLEDGSCASCISGDKKNTPSYIG